MGMPGLPEMIIIFAVVFMLFGAKRLPELGGAIGESIKNLKDGLKDKPADTRAAAPTAETAKLTTAAGEGHEKEKADA